MAETEKSLGKVIAELREREKELECIYQAKALARKRLPLEDFFNELVRLIPMGWQYPEKCRARIKFEGWKYTDAPWPDCAASQHAHICVDEQILGAIEVCYVEDRHSGDGGSLEGTPGFLPQEQKLLNALADVAGIYVFDLRLDQSIRVLRQQSEARLADGDRVLSPQSDTHWRWRERMAMAVANRMDFEKFAIRAVYLIGSTRTSNAGPASDIDLLVHHDASEEQLLQLSWWLKGWSSCLAELNHERTGYEVRGLLDVHFVTDADIAARNSYAIMIDSPVSRARALRIARPEG